MAEDAVPWMRALAVWLVIMVVESLHGTLRQLYLAPLLGDLAARRVSVLTGTGLMFIVALCFGRWLRVRETRILLRVGALWVTLTVLFEVALGRFVFGYGWGRIAIDYDLTHGGLMGLGLMGMLFMPLAAARLRGLRRLERCA